VFGNAVSLDLEKARIGWADLDQTPESRRVLAAFTASGRFDIVAAPVDDYEIRDLLAGDDVDGCVRIGPGFARDIKRGRTSTLQILVQGTNSNTAQFVSSYANQIVSRIAGEFAADQTRWVTMRTDSQSPAGSAGTRLEPRSRVLFNPELRSRNYFVPGVMANILMLVTLGLTALAVVREKELGTFEQLMVTPVRAAELLIGKTAPFAAVAFIDLIFVTGAAIVFFDLPFRGSPLLLGFCSLLFIVTMLGLGLLLSTVSQTQQQAIMGSFFFTMPALMLSGFTFPIRNMPEPIQWLTFVNPMRYYIEIVRGVVLKGIGLSVLWPQTLALAVFAVVLLWLGAVRFRSSRAE
jgi:ABC-2 type transport system permease protein